MFAPPPIQLSLAQIEESKRQREQREAERKAKENVTKDQEESNPLQRLESQTSKKSKKSSFFGRGGSTKAKKGEKQPTVSNPILTAPKRSGSQNQETAGQRAERKVQSPIQNGKNAPPKRPSRPTMDLLPPVSTEPHFTNADLVSALRPMAPISAEFLEQWGYMGDLPDTPAPKTTRKETATSNKPAGSIASDMMRKLGRNRKLPPVPGPPAIPIKSPRRQNSVNTGLGIETAPEAMAQKTHLSLSPKSNSESVSDSSVVLPLGRARAATSPSFSTDPTLKSTSLSGSTLWSETDGSAKRNDSWTSLSSSLSSKDKRLSGVHEGKIQKAVFVAKRANTVLQYTRRSGKKGAQAGQRNSSQTTSGEGISPLDIQMPWRRRRKGESMSMLISSGFFLPDALASDQIQQSQSPKSVSSDQPSPSTLVLRMNDLELPETPGSVAATPTEMYANFGVSTGPRPMVVRRGQKARGRKTVTMQRSPLASVTSITESSKSMGSVISRPSNTMNNVLAAIPELFDPERRPSTISMPSGTSTPRETKIHLRSGSVLTVTTPEMTAWQRTIYTPGPIRLQPPTITRFRSNSIASLDPFQEVVEQVYQDALIVSKQDIEEKIVDDLCQWYDEFGFANVSYDGDRFEGQVPKSELEQGNKPSQKGASSTLSPVPELRIAPAETEETLRAKGIARLSGHSRKESSTLSKADRADHSDEGKDRVYEPISGDQGFDWDDDVGKTDGWVFGNSSKNQRGTSTNGSMNPVSRFRRLVAGASTML